MPQRRFTRSDYTEGHADAFAARYDDGFRRIKLARLDQALGRIDGLRILDAGCGVGAVAHHCAALGARVIACDFSDAMISRARERYGSSLPLLQTSAEALPFKAGSFDVVLALDVIEHLYEPRRMLASAHRLLTPRGRLIVVTDRVGLSIGSLIGAPASLIVAAGRRARIFCGGSSPPSRYATPQCTHVREYTRRSLTGIVRQAGFRLTHVDTFPNRASRGVIGVVIDMVARGPLRLYKWNHAIYAFEKTESIGQQS